MVPGFEFRYPGTPFSIKLNVHQQTQWDIENQVKTELNNPSPWCMSIQPTWHHCQNWITCGCGNKHICFAFFSMVSWCLYWSISRLFGAYIPVLFPFQHFPPIFVIFMPDTFVSLFIFSMIYVFFFFSFVVRLFAIFLVNTGIWYCIWNCYAV